VIESLDLWLMLGGLAAGLLVGLTGMGGAVLVTPLLIVIFGIPPAVAVSSDIVANAVIKPVGSWVHVRSRTVHWRLVLWLSVGSVPGVLVGSFVFARLASSGDGVLGLKTVLGWVLLLALATMFARPWVVARWGRGSESVPREDPRRGTEAPARPVATVVVGLLVGLAVGITSVGSGSLIVMSLLLLYPLLASRVLVGTDLTQAVPMLVAGALAHSFVGAVDWRITAALLVGQIPGVWIGARISSRYDGSLIRSLLMVVLTATALRLLGLPTAVCGAIALAGMGVVLALLVRERLSRPDPEPAL